MRSLRYFVAWLFRRLFGNLGSRLYELHLRHIDHWRRDWVGNAIAIVIANFAIVLISAAIYGLLGRWHGASYMLLTVFIVELVYLVFGVIHNLWLRYQEEQAQMMKQLKE